jgi:hypothetical protein
VDLAVLLGKAATLARERGDPAGATQLDAEREAIVASGSHTA